MSLDSGLTYFSHTFSYFDISFSALNQHKSYIHKGSQAQLCVCFNNAQTPLCFVTRGNDMHGRPSHRPKAASFKKRAGLSRGTENREEVGEKGPGSGESRSGGGSEGARKPISDIGKGSKAERATGTRMGRTEAKSLLLLRERRREATDIMHTQGRRRDGEERERERERATVDAHLNATFAAAAVTPAAIGMLKSRHREWRIILSKTYLRGTQAGPGGTVKEQQEQISPNHMERIFLCSVLGSAENHLHSSLHSWKS